MCQFWFYAQQMQIKSDQGQLVNIETVLQQYIQIPSISGVEKEAGEFLKKVCKNNMLHISDFGNEDGQYNFAASVFPLTSNKPNIIFLNHIDVVPESSGNEHKAYSGDIKEGIIYGRGAIDNKGAAMMQLYGILKFMNENDLEESEFNITFLAVSCEETQCQGGISYVIQHHYEELNAAVVLGEGPSELTSLMEGDFDNPVFGVSIITKKPKAIFNDINTQFLKDMALFHKGGKRMILKHPKFFRPIVVPNLRSHPELFSLFTNTITLTNIYSNSKAVNKLASVAGAQLDCRLLPDTNEQEFLTIIRKKLKNEDIKIKVIKSSPNVEPSNTETSYRKNLALAIQQNYPTATTMNMMMPNTNDLGGFRAKNIPSYGTLPIYCDTEEVRSVHGKNEHLHINSLYNGGDVFASFLKLMISEK